MSDDQIRKMVRDEVHAALAEQKTADRLFWVDGLLRAAEMLSAAIRRRFGIEK